MSKTLPESSRKQHAGTAHLTRKRGVYHYRRLVPEHLADEVTLSLGTRSFREAEHLAEGLNPTFNLAVQSAATAADLRAALRKYLEDALVEGARIRLTLAAGRPVFGLGEEAPTERDPVELDEGVIAVALTGAQRALASRYFPSVQASVEESY